MPGSPTTPSRPSACVGALSHVAFRYTDSVGTQNQFSIAAQWLACTFPCRRFADILADACTRLRAADAPRGLRLPRLSVSIVSRRWTWVGVMRRAASGRPRRGGPGLSGGKAKQGKI